MKQSDSTKSDKKSNENEPTQEPILEDDCLDENSCSQSNKSSENVEGSSTSNDDNSESVESESVESVESDNRENKNKKILSIINSTFLTMMFTALSISVLSSVLLDKFSLDKPVINKVEVIEDLNKLITNNADLRAIKFYYERQSSKSITINPLQKILYYFGFSQGVYISASTPLSIMLEDIRTNYYLHNNDNPELLVKLEEIIKNHSESNPFDKLELSQKDIFENIRIKSQDNYPVISNDLNKLSDEIFNKNQLVTEYLSDSRTSLYVSIASACIAVLLAGLQMYQARTTKLAKKLAEELTNHNNLDENEYLNTRSYANDDIIHTRTYKDSKGRIIRMTKDKDGRTIRRVLHPA